MSSEPLKGRRLTLFERLLKYQKIEQNKLSNFSIKWYEKRSTLSKKQRDEGHLTGLHLEIKEKKRRKSQLKLRSQKLKFKIPQILS